METVLKDSKLCTGCGACAASCANHAITMETDEEGFLLPTINSETCTDCELCKRVCPVNPEHPKDQCNGEPIQVLAAWHFDDETRRQSSSGGVFTALAQNILNRDGVVVGAAFDEKLVVRHILIESSDELHRLRGSKYIQSEVSVELYQRIRKELQLERLVLFSGTPCQVSGLRSYLQKEYDGLYCCDLVCHGTPSALVWKKYLEYRQDQGFNISQVSFRDKRNGWRRSGPAIKLAFSDGSSRSYNTWDDPFTILFLKDISFRMACYSCRFAKKERSGDLTLGDFWGISNFHPEYDREDKGTSLVLVNSARGKKILMTCKDNLFLGKSELSNAIPGNPMLKRPAKMVPERHFFYKDLRKGFKYVTFKYQIRSQSLASRICRRLLRIFYQLRLNAIEKRCKS